MTFLRLAQWHSGFEQLANEPCAIIGLANTEADDPVDPAAQQQPFALAFGVDNLLHRVPAGHLNIHIFLVAHRVSE